MIFRIRQVPSFCSLGFDTIINVSKYFQNINRPLDEARDARLEEAPLATQPSIIVALTLFVFSDTRNYLFIITNEKPIYTARCKQSLLSFTTQNTEHEGE